MPYKKGQKIRYKTSYVKTQYRKIVSQEKVGIIEEVFSTVDNRPCYWVEGEKELILDSQVIMLEI